MGFYIETGSFLKGKADIIARGLNGTILPQAPKSYNDIPADKALIVVVDNGVFEAAGFAYNEPEFKMMTDMSRDKRPRKYVLIDRSKAEDLTNYPDEAAAEKRRKERAEKGPDWMHQKV